MFNDSKLRFAELPDAVQWSEGMLLSPQHFQQSDIYWHAQAGGRMAALNPDYWGLVSLRLDAKAWADGVLKLAQVSAILPDGLPVEFPLDEESRHITLDLNDKELLPADGKPLRIWLGSPCRTGDAARQDIGLQRYESRSGSLAVDENTGSNPISVPRLRANLTLIADRSVLSRYSAFPLLDVMRNADGHLQLGEFHPPMLCLGASEFFSDLARETGLVHRLGKLSKQVWDKLRELADQVDEENVDPATNGPNHLALARVLAQALAYFDVVATCPNSHPRQAYHALALLVGQATALDTSPIPPRLTAYCHEDCAAQFEQALSYVARRLSAIDTDLERLPFANTGETGFMRNLEAHASIDQLVIELKPRAGQGIKDLQSWLENARIASDDFMPILRHRRLPGALARPLDRQERHSLGLSENALLFLITNQSIDLNGSQQRVFRAGRPLQILGAADGSMPSGILLYRWKAEQPPLLSRREGISPAHAVATDPAHAEPAHV